MVSRLPSKISTPPERWGSWLYYRCISEGNCRKLAGEKKGWLNNLISSSEGGFGREQVLLDWNEIAEKHDEFLFLIALLIICLGSGKMGGKDTRYSMLKLSSSVILQTSMNGGHFHDGGHIAHCLERAFEYTFLLKVMGVLNQISGHEKRAA